VQASLEGRASDARFARRTGRQSDIRETDREPVAGRGRKRFGGLSGERGQAPEAARGPRMRGPSTFYACVRTTGGPVSGFLAASR
jgi:hypothetical protein